MPLGQPHRNVVPSAGVVRGARTATWSEAHSSEFNKPEPSGGASRLRSLSSFRAFRPVARALRSRALS
jgi:hypothetical protein